METTAERALILKSKTWAAEIKQVASFVAQTCATNEERDVFLFQLNEHIKKMDIDAAAAKKKLISPSIFVHEDK